MVFLDVVYNHFGPAGNALHRYAPQFFTHRHSTPWGEAIDFTGEGNDAVREFVIHNALFWLEEYHLDGLRLDSVHAIFDERRPDILTELAAAVRNGPGAERHVHLVLENDDNRASCLSGHEQNGNGYTAQWNDDAHHALHVVLTGETDGYYSDYAGAPVSQLGRALAEGFVYQGEHSRFRDRPRGESSAHLPPTAFVPFLQNHDQIGNRAMGDRIATLAPAEAIRAAHCILLLSPSPPLFFMGEEFGTEQPFLFFCDFEGDLAHAVRNGRRQEFARFDAFASPESLERIPDPNALETFERCVLDWKRLDTADGVNTLAEFRALIALRRNEIVPRIPGMRGNARHHTTGDTGLRVEWELGDGSLLTLLANLGEQRVTWSQPRGRLLYAVPEIPPALDDLPPWSVAAYLAEPTPPSE
jgi:malto-oligosyltrehalose trehalohydrolase